MNNRFRGIRFILMFAAVVTLAQLSCGIYAGSDVQATAIALGKTQGAPQAATQAVATVIAAQATAANLPPTPTRASGLSGLLPLMPTLPDTDAETQTLISTPLPQIGMVTTKTDQDGKALWHWFQNQAGIVGYSEFWSGTTTGTKGSGQIRSGFQLPTFQTASVDHYYAVRITGWLEFNDIDTTKMVTSCIVHDWGDHAGENKQQCHAHLFPAPEPKNINTIMGVITPGITLRILETDEARQMYRIELTRLFWFSSDQVDFSK